jgi:hypothetical protein
MEFERKMDFLLRVNKNVKMLSSQDRGIANIFYKKIFFHPRTGVVGFALEKESLIP